MRGLVAATFAASAAYIAAVMLLADSRPGGNKESVRDPGSSTPSALRFPASDYRQSQFPRLDRRPPLIGANYTHYVFRNCTFYDTDILTSYQRPGVAEKVHAELFQMRKAGIATIRTVIWHTTDATPYRWGVISSAGGKIHEPNRMNLIRYLQEVKKFGFARFTLVFGPKYSNDPLLSSYKPSKFRENWRFIRAVRSLVKRYGPAETRIDLSSEGAPNETPTTYEPVPKQTGRYLRGLYRLYVRRFGNRDVTISTTASMNPAGPTNRVQTSFESSDRQASRCQIGTTFTSARTRRPPHMRCGTLTPC